MIRDTEEEVVDAILKDTSLCPCLLIGRYVNIFKKKYTGSIERIYSLSDVRSLISEYEGIQSINSKYLVLEGVGYLSSVGQNSLLKFIEESRLPIILLSYNDKISPIILSRMFSVYKSWYSVKSLSFQTVDNALSSLQEKKSENKDFKEYEEIQYMADNSPTLYSITQQAGDKFDYLNTRLIGLMSVK